MGERLEILRSWVGDDVAVLRPTHNPPRTQRQATDDHKADIRLNEAPEKLIKTAACSTGAQRRVAQLEQLTCEQNRLFEVHNERSLPILTQPHPPHTLPLRITRLLLNLLHHTEGGRFELPVRQ